MKIYTLLLIAAFTLPDSAGQSRAVEADTTLQRELSGVEVVAQQSGTTRLRGAVNATRINRTELMRAACCNLGESFSTNASVDVTYDDATTGARQIKLLGLNGTYVQLLTENIPNYGGAAAPYALGYVPGPWMKSISISKGASSVTQGYEGIAGQIDIEYLKPEDPQGATGNAYINTDGRYEVNADANVHLNKRLNTILLVHHENAITEHDSNHDGFMDQPRLRQFNVMNRWDRLGDRYVFHGGASVLNERRRGGQSRHADIMAMEPYTTLVNTTRAEAYMKHGFILDGGASVALVANATYHDMDATIGHRLYDLKEWHGRGQLLFDKAFSSVHSLSAGVSIVHDNLDQHHLLDPAESTSTERWREREIVSGAYAQYTLQPTSGLTVMAGLRWDYSSEYGGFVTPRLHLRYAPSSGVTLRLSAGKGYHSPRALAQNFHLMATGRTIIIDDPRQESAWNYGVSATWNIPLAARLIKLSAEYYFTHFLNQYGPDYDAAPSVLRLTNLGGRSRAHTMQVDATCTIVEGLDATIAYRLNDVRATYGGIYREKPLNSRYKGLLSLSYKSPMVIWQVDATLQLNGGGRLPAMTSTPEGRFPAFVQLQAQVTRWFRHWSIYAGAENLGNYRQKNPIVAAADPWSADFDATRVWAPTHGIVGYVGVRVNLGNHQ